MEKLEYSRSNTNMNLEWVHNSTYVVIYFLILTDLTSFLLSFVLWSFQVLGEDLMDYGIRSGKILILGIPKAPQFNIQGQPKV